MMKQATLHLLAGFLVFTEASIPSVPLHNAADTGVAMPATGLGTGGYGNSHAKPIGQYPECWSDGNPDPYGAPGNANCSGPVERSIRMWLKAGGRRIDSGDTYANVPTAGKAITASRIRREDLFLVGKVGSPLPLGAADTMLQVQVTLEQYQTSYFDLLLIHWPTSPGNSSDPVCNFNDPDYDARSCRLNTWKAMIALWKSGQARAVGVSNYNIEHLQEIIDAGLPLPAVNQCPYNPHLYTAQRKLVAFCQSHNIVFNSYSPLGIPDWHMYSKAISSTGRIIDEPAIKSIGARLGLSAAQVLLAWQWKQGVVMNPRSMSLAHMQQNLDTKVFNTNLSPDDMAVLNGFQPDKCTSANSWYECCGNSSVQPSIPSCGISKLPFGVVDTHVHLMTTGNGINYTWAKQPSSLSPPQMCPCRPPCACNMSISEYELASDATVPVDFVVFCEVSAIPADWLKEAIWVQSVAEQRHLGPKVGAILAQPPPGFGVQDISHYSAQLDELQQRVTLLRGVRAHLDMQDRQMLIQGLRELGKRSLVVDTFVPDITDPRVHEIVSQAPGTDFVIEHFGCGCNVQDLVGNQTLFTQWQAALAEMSALQNVKCLQLGGTMAGFGSRDAVKPELIKPMLQSAIKYFGYNRVCFESNWFFSNWKTSLTGYGVWATSLLTLLHELGASENEVKKVFRDNAINVYSIRN